MYEKTGQFSDCPEYTLSEESIPDELLLSRAAPNIFRMFRFFICKIQKQKLYFVKKPTIYYNNYPFPKDLNDKQKERVEKAAQAVLDAGEKYPDSSLADLYDPLAMPPDLVKAQKESD